MLPLLLPHGSHTVQTESEPEPEARRHLLLYRCDFISCGVALPICNNIFILKAENNSKCKVLQLNKFGAAELGFLVK